MNSEFKPLKKGDLVTAADIWGVNTPPHWSLQKRGFILGEVERGAKRTYTYCKIHVIVQSKDSYSYKWYTTIQASQLVKVQLYKPKKKHGKV